MHVTNIGYGNFGTAQTVAKMRQLVNSSLTDPRVIQTARSIGMAFYPRDTDSQARAIKDYLKEHFQFINDPRGVELLVAPGPMLDTISKRGIVAGDCDEAAILGAALGKAIGLRARFVLLGFTGRAGPYAHVFAILRGASSWVSLDVTKPLRGPFPPVTRHTSVEV